MTTTTKNLILTKSQWNDLFKWFPNNDQQQKDEDFLEFVRETSAAMRAKWPENQKSQIEEKPQKVSTNPYKIRFEMIKRADDATRRKMIEEAEKFVTARKIKECPIDLRSAAILSENLAGRKIQLEFLARIKEEEKAKNLERNQSHMAQSIAWLKDGFEHRSNAFKVAVQHKRDLMKQIEDRKMQRDTEKATRIAEEQRDIATHEKNIVEQKVRARKAREEQNEYMRAHEVETVRMAKQKQARLKRENEVVGVLAKVHEEGKQNIREMIKQQQQQERLERMQMAAKLASQALIRDRIEREALRQEQEAIEKIRLEKEKLLDVAEEKTTQRKLSLRHDRRQDYDASLQAAADKRALQKEEDKEYLKNRLYNDVVSQAYVKTKREKQTRKTMETLNFLKQQAKETRQLNRELIESDKRDFNQEIQRDKRHDHKFFAYADDLLQDVAAKNRPAKPIVQVIKKYKNFHFIDAVKKLRPHEISNVPIDQVSQENATATNVRGKSKRMLRYEKDEELLKNVYRSTKFLSV